VVLVSQGSATAAPGAGYGRLEIVSSVLGVRHATAGWIALVDLATTGQIAGLTEKVTPVDADLILIEDSAAANVKKKVQIGNLPGGGAGGLYDAYVCVVDEKAQNTAGGGFTSGAWQTRDLNTERADTASIASLAANQITLPAGTYQVRAMAPAFMGSQHQARLYDVTGAAVLVVGTSEVNFGTDGGSSVEYHTSKSFVVGRFTLSVESVIELQHRCSVTRATDGFGYPANLTTEVYSVVELWRES